VSFTTDWRFSPERSREIVSSLLAAEKNVSYAEIDLAFGHDSFLLDDPYYHSIIDAQLKKVQV
jgi:homoserine O-acetyltransferase